MLTNANYVQWQRYTMPPSQFIAFVAATALGVMHIITVKEKKRIRIIAFVLHVIRMVEVETSHAMAQLFPRQILTKKRITENAKKR